MANQSVPLIDEQNPLYCPEFSASAYVHSLRRRLHSKTIITGHSRDQNLLYSFARILGRAFLEDKGHHSSYYPPSPSDSDSDDSSGSSSTSFSTYHDWPHHFSSAQPAFQTSKRNRPSSSPSCTDLQGPAKRARSSLTVDSDASESFAPAKHNRLRFFSPNTHDWTWNDVREQEQRRRDVGFEGSDSIHELIYRVRDLEEELYGPPIGPDTPDAIHVLINLLENLLPGIRLKQRLLSLDDPTHQKIADFLAKDGLLTETVLNALRMADIRCLALTASMIDQGGLNLAGRGLLTVFSKPNSFLYLSELNCSSIPLQNIDLIHIHHLPTLSSLLLNDTGISNEGVFLLTSLKRSLTHLCIASNPLIDDDAVPALLILSNLSFLALLDTSINMPGLRRFAKTIREENRIIDIQIPSICDTYIDNLHRKYDIQPQPPLITRPEVCAQLSSTALRRNLAAHASYNSDIVATGTKMEMVERLEGILKIRELDLVVMGMIWGEDG